VIESLLLGLTFGIAFFLVKSWLNYRALPELLSELSASMPDVTIIIPARNEAKNIANAIRSFPASNVVVVDDHSTDATKQVALANGARVIEAPPLAPGALGKPSACRAGARAAETDWMLFVDADTWYEPEFLPSVVQYAQTRNLELVSVFLDSTHNTVMEKLLLPYAFALYFAGVSARAVNSADSRQALANGQCMLFKRTAYERIGGHGAVLNSVIEDVALAKAAKLMGVRMRTLRAENLGHVRMYDSLRAIWRGLQKNSFRFLLINPWTGLQVMAASVLLTSWLPVLAGTWSAGVQGRVGTEALLLAVTPSVCLLPWYLRGNKPSGWIAASSPLAIYLFQLIALDGMLTALTGRKANWKDRRV
jgi:cellulose synthase/poly-beta-1,6-N-acetylglucosamine synthase-like glycosyltransferase